jgi:nucleoside-diphosphate-sugar epimerase
MSGTTKGKLALVTGASGHTGSFLVNALVKEGWRVVATDLKPAQRDELMKKEKVFRSDLRFMPIDLPGVTFITADLTNKESLQALFDDKLFVQGEYEAIFHPASLYDYFAELDILRKINVGGLKNLLEVIYEHFSAKKKPIPHMIHWSTCGVYGEPEYEKDEKGFTIPSNEDVPLNPINNYCISKKEQEDLLRSFAADHGIKYTIIRPGPIYGPYQAYGAFHIFYMTYKLGTMVVPYIVPRKNMLIMPMVHVEDLVQAAMFVWNKPEAFGQAYNALGENLPQDEWMEFTFQELGINYFFVIVPWFFYKFAANYFGNIVKKLNKKAKAKGTRPKIDLAMADYVTHGYNFSNQKIKDLGFKFKYGDPKVGTRQTIDWYKKHHWLENEADVKWDWELENK